MITIQFNSVNSLKPWNGTRGQSLYAVHLSLFIYSFYKWIDKYYINNTWCNKHKYNNIENSA